MSNLPGPGYSVPGSYHRPWKIRLGGAVVFFLILLPFLSGRRPRVAAQDGIGAPGMHLDAERGQTGDTLTLCEPRGADPADRVSFHFDGLERPPHHLGCNP